MTVEQIPRLPARQQRSELAGNQFVQIEKGNALDRFQGPPYLFPTSGRIRSIQHIDEGSFEVGNPDM